MEILRKEFKLKGKTVLEFAKDLNVSETAVYLWLSGKFLPKAVHIKKMIDLGYSEDAVLNPSKEV